MSHVYAVTTLPTLDEVGHRADALEVSLCTPGLLMLTLDSGEAVAVYAPGSWAAVRRADPGHIAEEESDAQVSAASEPLASAQHLADVEASIAERLNGEAAVERSATDGVTLCVAASHLQAVSLARKVKDHSSLYSLREDTEVQAAALDALTMYRGRVFDAILLDGGVPAREVNAVRDYLGHDVTVL